jgi:hypothetical protein
MLSETIGAKDAKSISYLSISRVIIKKLIQEKLFSKYKTESIIRKWNMIRTDLSGNDNYLRYYFYYFEN